MGFGEFLLDFSRGTLKRADEEINLRPQTFEVLSILATHAGKLVSKEELLETVWRGASVTDDSLTQCIVEIRKAIGDDSRTIVHTIPKRGFIFDPPATSLPGPTDGQSASAGKRIAPSRATLYGVAAVLIVAAVVTVLRWTGDEGIPPADLDAQVVMSPNSIAVLPFVDMSETQDQQYFGDGIAEEILTELTRYPDLAVVARTSSFIFREQNADVLEIGRRLNAAYVLEGSIRKSGDMLRITAQLIESHSGTHVWSHAFNRALTIENVLDIQSDVAANVAKTIAAGETPRTAEQSIVASAANTKAYELYLEGMFFLQQIRMAETTVYDREVYNAAMDRFKKSIRHDPSWAPSHAALGRTMHFLAGTFEYTGEKRDEDYWYGLAKAHLLKAIEVDPGYAQAYSSLGHVLHQLEFDFAGAEEAYATAKDLGGYFPWGYALFLRSAGRFDEAIDEYQLAIEHDPLSFGPRRQLASTYRCAGRFEESKVEIEKILRMAPSRTDLYLGLTFLNLQLGNMDEGRTLFEKHKDPARKPIQYGEIYAMLGMDDDAYEVLAQADADSRWWVNDYVGTALKLGEEGLALDYLEAAADDHFRNLVHLPCVHGIRSLSGNKRFQRILADAGFPEDAI